MEIDFTKSHTNKHTTPNTKQTKKGKTMNIKTKAFITYFENLDHIKRQKRKQFLLDLFDFIGLIFMILITYWIIF